MLNKCDLLICWIKHCDYPIFRWWLKLTANTFNRVYILFSEHNRFPYFDHFIQSELTKDLGNITFLDPVQYQYGVEDWRNVATNEMLKHSDSEWVCSIEQDWLTRDMDELLEKCEKEMKKSDLFGWMNPSQNPYIHPAFFFAKRELIEKTGKDFSPHSEIIGSDHFAMITYKAKELGYKVTSLDVGEVKPDSPAFHLGGINQNYLDGINSSIFHRPEIFAVYNYYNKRLNVEQHPVFMEMMDKVEKLLPTDPNSPWAEFFK